MKVKFLGPEPTLTIGDLVFQRGRSVEVAEDVARDLLTNYPFAKVAPVGRPKGHGSAASGRSGVETR